MADFIIGDYQYHTTGRNASVQVVDTTKSNYEPLNSTVVYNNVTYTITNMGSCFKNCTSLNQSITIPNSVTNLISCFENCISLDQPITIPNSVTNMNSSFKGCTNFNQPITIPDSVISMFECFKDCTSFNQSVTIFDSVTSLTSCFKGCTSFNQSITIPNSVEFMGSCFYGCTSFNQLIIIPNSVENMNYCFNGCTSFNQSITIPNSVTNMTGCFYNCTSLAKYIFVNNASTNPSIFGGTINNIKIFVIDNNNSNGYSAWENIVSQYNNVSIGTLSDITTSNSFILGDYIYKRYSNSGVGLNINVIDRSKQSYESILSTISFNNNDFSMIVTDMENCFKGCTSFNQSITIPNSVTNLTSCFQECTSFNQPITIPNSVTSVSHCFDRCTNFNQLITIPNLVTDMSYCFFGCTNFNQPITIPNLVTDLIGCFWSCTNFNQPITIPNSVINMNYCFFSCISFNQPIIIPNSVTSMLSCFGYCTNFNQSITIPNSVENMSNCFWNCTSLAEYIFVNNAPTNSSIFGSTTYSSIFESTINNIKIFVIDNNNSNGYSAWENIVSQYNNVSIGTLSDITTSNSFILGDYIYKRQNNSNVNLSISVIDRFKQSYESILNTIYFNNNNFSMIVTDMSGCFHGCTSFNQSVTIPNSVEDMSGCFHGCTSFNQSVTIPNSVEDMSDCFKNCIALNNNIIVMGYRSNNSGFFAGTNKPIYICLGSGSESAANGWRQVAAQYPNVHFEVDDHPAPNLTLTATRGTGTGENWVSSADGDSIKLEATWSINTDFLPYGYEVIRNNPEVFLDNDSSGDEFTTNIIYKTLNAGPLNQHTFTAQLSDGHKTTTVTAIITRAGALLDFLGNQNSKSPYVDEPGMGMAIGTFAIRSGLDIEFPTTIGNGLIPPTQPIFSENPNISTDTSIQLDKNYYVLGGGKYYKVNIIKGTIEENNKTVEKPFILTKDNSLVSGKTYYETDDKIIFETLTPLSGANPVNEGWYEEDTRSPHDNNWYAATQEAIDLNNYQLTIGDYNLQDPGIQSMYGDVALIIGNGTDNANRSNAVTIGKDGLVGAYINYDTDTPGIDPETGQYFTRFAIINSNNNKVTYIDAHKWSGDKTLGVFGAQRMFYNNDGTADPIQNQFGLGINSDKSLFVFMSDPAKEAWNAVLNADHITSRGTSGIWTYRKWRSGDAECWGLIASKSYAMTQGPWGTGYYSQGNTVNFPSGLFTSTPTVSLNKCSSGNGLEWISIYGVTTSGVTYYACDTKSGTISFAIAAYARGRWK